jgi:hypothetical protein
MKNTTIGLKSNSIKKMGCILVEKVLKNYKGKWCRKKTFEKTQI